MRISRIIVALAVGVAALAGGCASIKMASASKEGRVTVAQLSPPARATVEKLTAGGRVDKIDKQVERGGSSTMSTRRWTVSPQGS